MKLYIYLLGTRVINDKNCGNLWVDRIVNVKRDNRDNTLDRVEMKVEVTGV